MAQPRDPVDVEFEDAPDPAGPHFGRQHAARGAAPISAAAALAELLDIGGEAARSAARVAGVVSPETAERVDRVADAATAGADVVRSGAAAVQSIQAETSRVAGPLAQKLRDLDERARAAGLYGQKAAPRGVHRGTPRPVTVKVGGK